MLVKWNVDYLAVEVAMRRVSTTSFCWSGTRSADDRDDQAHCWVLRDRALAALPLGRSPHRTTRSVRRRIRDAPGSVPPVP